MRKLAEVPRILTAAPSYIRLNGAPGIPADLERHAMLLYTLADDWEHLTFQRNGLSERLSVKGAITCNDGMALRQAALDGLGLLVQPAYVVREDIEAGRLLRFFPNGGSNR